MLCQSPPIEQAKTKKSDRALSEKQQSVSAQDLATSWRSRLAIECPEQSVTARESIIWWLLGEDMERFASLNSTELKFAQQAMEYRYRLLKRRYLGQSSQKAYRLLTTRLGSIVLLQNKIRIWISLSRDRSLAIKDVLQELLQELLYKDRYIQQQVTWIAQCSEQVELRNVLLFADLEEYCLRPVRNQPLLVYRFINYLNKMQRGGLTHIGTNDSIRLVSQDVFAEENENSISLLDRQAIASYQDIEAAQERQMLRDEVKAEFERYLAQKIGDVAVQWLRLYLQGKTQQAIATSLNLPIKQVYRLREKIQYHAVNGYARKCSPTAQANLKALTD